MFSACALLGNNLWILPVSIAIASWIIYYLDQTNRWWILYIAIICSLISILHICSVLFIWIKNVIKRHQERKAAKEAVINRCEQERAAQERRTREHASLVWHYVANFESDKIRAATIFFDCPIHDGNKYIRFVKRPKQNDWKKYDAFCTLYNLIQEYQFSGDYYVSKLFLLNKTDIKEGFYVEYDPYFYSLLENYENSKKWEKL